MVWTSSLQLATTWAKIWLGLSLVLVACSFMGHIGLTLVMVVGLPCSWILIWTASHTSTTVVFSE
jgi:hypothetical protein